MRSTGSKIDQRFFVPTVATGPSDAWKDRLGLLNKHQMDETERLVTRKLEEMEDRILAWDPDEYTEAFRQKVMRKRKKQMGPRNLPRIRS